MRPDAEGTFSQILGRSAPYCYAGRSPGLSDDRDMRCTGASPALSNRRCPMRLPRNFMGPLGLRRLSKLLCGEDRAGVGIRLVPQITAGPARRLSTGQHLGPGRGAAATLASAARVAGG